MELLLKRHTSFRYYQCAQRATIGDLLVPGVGRLVTLEPYDMCFCKSDSAAQIRAAKAERLIAIPYGLYSIRLDVTSARFGSLPFYKETCGGCLPRLIGVPAFSGILIHCGNTISDTNGCILVGTEYDNCGFILNSRVAFTRLMSVLRECRAANEEVTINITHTWNV